MVLFELPFLDGVFVHEPLRLFEGDALLVVGGGRIVGDGQQSADAFHDSFRIHMFVGHCRFLQLMERLMVMVGMSMSGTPASAQSTSARRMIWLMQVLCAHASSHCQHCGLHMP